MMVGAPSRAAHSEAEVISTDQPFVAFPPAKLQLQQECGRSLRPPISLPTSPRRERGPANQSSVSEAVNHTEMPQDFEDSGENEDSGLRGLLEAANHEDSGLRLEQGAARTHRGLFSAIVPASAGKQGLVAAMR